MLANIGVSFKHGLRSFSEFMNLCKIGKSFEQKKRAFKNSPDFDVHN